MSKIDMNFYESNEILSGASERMSLINVREIFEELEKESW